MNWNAKKIIGIIVAVLIFIILSKTFMGLAAWLLKVLLILVVARVLFNLFGGNVLAFVGLAVLGFFFCWGAASWIVGLSWIVLWIMIIILIPLSAYFLFKRMNSRGG